MPAWDEWVHAATELARRVDYPDFQRDSITPDAILNVQEAAGVDDEDRRALLQRLPALGDADAAAVLLGVVLGRLTT